MQRVQVNPCVDGICLACYETNNCATYHACYHDNFRANVAVCFDVTQESEVEEETVDRVYDLRPVEEGGEEPHDEPNDGKNKHK